MSDRTYNVLFLCTGNSARSVLAEAILNRAGAGRLRAWSAGSQPKGQVHPLTIEVLRERGYDTAELRSKSWSELAAPGAPQLDLVFTVCDNAAAESCPIWPGRPVTGHWGVRDPAAVIGSDAERLWAFRRAYLEMRRRIELLLELPIASLDRLALETKIKEIGTSTPPVADADVDRAFENDAS
jgi:arsenate reductase (thioredoxin)